MSVGRLCVREVDVAQPSETAWQGAERMHDRAVGTLVVQDEYGRPVGIVTDRDLVERVMVPNKDPCHTSIAEIMTPNPVKAYEHSSIEAAVQLMQSGGFRRLPVVDGDDRLVGLLSLDDVLSLLCEEFSSIGELLAKQLPRSVIAKSI